MIPKGEGFVQMTCVLPEVGLIKKFFMFSLPAVLRVAGSLQKSTEVMKAMQNLIKIPEIQATMRELSKEMMKVRSIRQVINFNNN